MVYKILLTLIFSLLGWLGISNAQTSRLSGQPLVLLAGVPQGDITLNQILATPRLVETDTSISVVRFTLLVSFGSDFAGPFDAKGPDLSPEMLRLLQQVGNKKGAKIEIEGIRARVDGFTRSLSGLNYMVNAHPLRTK